MSSSYTQIQECIPVYKHAISHTFKRHCVAIQTINQLEIELEHSTDLNSKISLAH